MGVLRMGPGLERLSRPRNDADGRSHGICLQCRGQAWPVKIPSYLPSETFAGPEHRIHLADLGR
jgi:hypothetical protein